MFKRDFIANFINKSGKLQTIDQIDENMTSDSLKLIDNPEYMILQNIVYLAKNFNFLGSLDRYMKELARLSIQLGEQQKFSAIQERLEWALNKEIVLK